MSKKKSQLQLAQDEAEAAIQKTNDKITELGDHTSQLYDQLSAIQDLFDRIRNIPTEEKLKYEELKKVRLNWRQQAEKIDSDFKTAAAKHAGAGAAGVGAGVAVVALGPTAAMGIATTFGVASTGTAISTLSGAAATNAALAWLGGGALAAGGGGMAAGNAFLALAGPIGWAIAGVALITSGLMVWKAKSDKNRLENVFTLISKRDVTSYELAIVELNERIERITNESEKLREGIDRIQGFGLDYSKMTEAQQYELGAYLNLMNSSTQLLVNPIVGLQPKYTEADLADYMQEKSLEIPDEKEQSLIVTIANLIYKIDLEDKDKKLLWKSFKGNKKFLESIEIKKKEFDFSIIQTACDALAFKRT